jgi:hypothetical protein
MGLKDIPMLDAVTDSSSLSGRAMRTMTRRRLGHA